jgi:hypothetical protein
MVGDGGCDKARKKEGYMNIKPLSVPFFKSESEVTSWEPST